MFAVTATFDLISDGDKSNYDIIIVEGNFYRKYGVEVENVQCNSHLKRNISVFLQ